MTSDIQSFPESLYPEIFDTEQYQQRTETRGENEPTCTSCSVNNPHALRMRLKHTWIGEASNQIKQNGNVTDEKEAQHSGKDANQFPLDNCEDCARGGKVA